MPKAGIHPTYYPTSKVTCSCGASYDMGSTKDSLKLDICRTCHPFYTGNQKLIDTAGRVDRFREKMLKAKPSKKSEIKSEKEEELSSLTESDEVALPIEDLPNMLQPVTETPAEDVVQEAKETE